MYWFGRPAHAPKIDHEGMLNDEVKRQLSIAYAELSALQNKLTVSPAPDVADICQLTTRLKEYC